MNPMFSLYKESRMNSLTSLIKRDMKIFYRTKGNIFFSSLAVIILLVLHFVIFRNMYTDNWEQILSMFPGFTIDRESILWIVDSLMFSAILPIGAVSISITALGLMVEDREKSVLNDFLVSPIKRNDLLASYLISSFVVGLIMLIGFIVFYGVYFQIMYGISYSLKQLGFILLATIGALIFANTFILLIMTFIKRQSSLGAFGTILGTMNGFISGAYIPVGMFGATVGTVLSALPFLQLTVLTRQAFLYNLESVTPLTHEMLSGELAKEFGLELWFGDTLVPIWGVAALAGGITLILLLCLIIRFAKMKKAD